MMNLNLPGHYQADEFRYKVLCWHIEQIMDTYRNFIKITELMIGASVRFEIMKGIVQALEEEKEEGGVKQ